MTTIYLSSTYSDLKTYREVVYRTLRKMRYDVIAMEDYVAADQRPVEKCLADVEACDLYVGLFAWRYGYIPLEGNPEHKSITELEYRKALQTGKPRFIFLLADDAPWSRTAMDEVTGEGSHGACITTLRDELVKGTVVSFFTTPNHLASQISLALHDWEIRQTTSASSNISAYARTKGHEKAEREARLKAMISDHSGFMRDRLESFVGRQQELAEVRRRIGEKLQTGGYVTITGQAGQGKSSIIAKLVEKYGRDNVAYHFIPFNPGPDHQVEVLRNLMARLIFKYELSDLYVASESRPALRGYFPKVLADLTEKGGQEVIFVDGLDQIKEDIDGERDLSFLPNDLPQGIVFVLGTRPDDALRPLKLLKPHDEYRLPNLSRQDFDLILTHRGIQLEKGLADEFYRVMQENALYLDLVARELAEDKTALPAAMMKQIADNPDNLFSLSMTRLKRKHSQWREVIKPILGVLLVASEPLSPQHIRQILEVEDDWLREGIERLGGLLAQDGQQRYSLFHLKLQDYLRQGEPLSKKEYVFALDEEEGWHKKLAQWCAQGNILTVWRDVPQDAIEQRRRDYARQHYITHLYYAREWKQLFEVLDTEQYGHAKLAYDPSMRSYTQDVDLGRQAATWKGWTMEEGIALLPRLWRYTLLHCSLASRADTYSPEVFEVLLVLKYEREALGLAELLTRPEYKARIFVLLGRWLERERERRQEGLQLFLRAQELTMSPEEGEKIAKTLGEISYELAQAHEWKRAQEVACLIKQRRIKADTLWMLGEALVQAQQWQQVEEIIGLIEEHWIKETLLHKMGIALAQAQQWERAEAIARLLKNKKDRGNILRELGIALVQAQKWRRADTLVNALEDIEDRTAILQEMGKVLTHAQRWMQAAIVWDKVLSLSHKIKEKKSRIQVLQELGETLTQVRQEERAEVVWNEFLAIAFTVEIGKHNPGVLQELINILIAAQQWERAEAFARSREDTSSREAVLREVGISLAKAQQWERAEAIARSVKDRWEREAVLRELGISLAQAQQWERAEAIARSLKDTGKREAVLREVGISLAKAHQWERVEMTLSEIQGYQEKLSVLQDYITQLARMKQLNEAKIIWAETVLLAGVVINSEEKAVLLRKITSGLSNIGEYEHVLRQLQRLWRQIDTREQAIELLPLATDLILLHPELAAAFCNAFTWVDTFFKG